MGIDITWRNEQGEELKTLPDFENRFAGIVNRLREAHAVDLPTMRTIDPYGETTIMPPRTVSLAHELEVARAEIADLATRVHLAAILQILRSASVVEHSYVEFVGD